MSEHLTPEEIGRYRERVSAAEEIARIQDHAGECAECRGRLALPGAVRALRAMLTAEPDEQELVRYALGQLPAERAGEIAEHVEGCAECTAALADLRRFARREAPAPIRHSSVVRWGAVAASLLLAGGLGWLALRPHPAPAELASLRDGAGRIALLASGQVTGIGEPVTGRGGLDAEERAWLSESLREGRLPAPAAAWTPPIAGVLRGPEDGVGFDLLAPVGMRVLSDRPRFRWQALPGAAAYRVTVFAEDEHVVAESGPLTIPEWQPATPLPRGQRLAWQVTAIRGGDRIVEPAPPQPRAILEPIAGPAAVRIDAARAQAAPSHLLLAILYAREGLRVEAAHELSWLAAANPGAPLVGRLEQSLGPQ